MHTIISLTELVQETCKKIKESEITLVGSPSNIYAIVGLINHINVDGFILQATYYHYSGGLLLNHSRLRLSKSNTLQYTHETKIIVNKKPIENNWFSHITPHNIMNFRTWYRLTQKCVER